MDHGALQALALASFFFVLAIVGRGICNLGFIERPIFIGFVWWLCTGDMAPALPLALFFELFWLDLIPIGSYVPPMPGFPYLILLALAGAMGWTEPAALAFPLAVLMPLAYVIPVLEYRQRNWQKYASTQLIALAESPRPLEGFPGRLIARSGLQQTVGGLLIFVLTYALAHYSFSLAHDIGASWGTGLIPLGVDWPILYIIAAIGALLSLRIKRAYFVFALCMAGMLLLRL